MPAVLQTNLLGTKRPYEAFCSLCRPKSLLVTPSRGARHMNDRDPPWSSCPSSVFVVEEGILPVGSHGWRWNIARNPARASVSLGTQESSLLQERLRASHGTVKNTGPIVAQPAQSWFRENDHKLWPRFTGRSPWTEKDQPRNEHCSCPQKGIGAQSIAASRSSVRMTRSQKSKSLNAWGRNTDPQNDYESSPTMT